MQLDIGNADAWTPLTFAIVQKNLEDVKLLLECGADMEKADKYGKTFRELCWAERFCLHLDQSCCLPGATSMYNGKSTFLQLI